MTFPSPIVELQPDSKVYKKHRGTVDEILKKEVI